MKVVSAKITILALSNGVSTAAPQVRDFFSKSPFHFLSFSSQHQVVVEVALKPQQLLEVVLVVDLPQLVQEVVVAKADLPQLVPVVVVAKADLHQLVEGMVEHPVLQLKVVFLSFPFTCRRSFRSTSA